MHQGLAILLLLMKVKHVADEYGLYVMLWDRNRDPPPAACLRRALYL